ncbi:LytR C-terminal domain-containing protein [Nocardioides sp. cx-169]|uniref:LytR C-terminal domain-containing protein n=1 Tax=Nocardioides sp. cx-169 TaxID=2899080 RepID=UPI001E64623E|nr:LytR C-terminal domain-containing protein [Nocardioides sp. cx-169]MCD4532780.1 LytR C-terminal domain-containing protein [Nocardioides sp. cx-169]
MLGFAGARLRSALTLLALALLLLVGVAWGWGAATEPFPEADEVPICSDTDVPAGTKVYPDQVTVSVANAGTREGLAGRTMQLLVDGGFGRGGINNAPDGTDVRFAEIWTDQPQSPAVKLVKSRLGKRAQVVRRDTTLPGVNVIVGDDFVELAKGGQWAKSDQDSVICSPPAEADDDPGVVD